MKNWFGSLPIPDSLQAIDITESLQLGVILMDTDLCIQGLSGRAKRMPGLIGPDAAGRSLHEVLPPDARNIEALARQALRGEGSPQVEVGAASRNYLLSFSPQRETGAGIRGVFCFVQDITEVAAIRRKRIVDLERVAFEVGRIGSFIRKLPEGEVHCSPEAKLLNGLSASEGPIPLAEWVCAILPDDRSAVLADVQATLADRLPARAFDYRVRCPDGSIRHVEGRTRYEYDEQGEPLRSVGVLIDVTERKQAETALREQQEFARSVVEASLDSIKVIGLDGSVLFMNGWGLRLMEIDDFEAVRGRPWTTLLPEPMAVEARISMERARAGLPSHFTGFGPTAKGTPKWWEVAVTPITGDAGEVVQILAICRDITERRTAEQQSLYLAYHDPLTNLPNRRFFKDRLEQELACLPDGEMLALLSVDLDQFKAVNDTLGHAAGDALLTAAAQRLRACIRAADMIARLGGDEFAIIQTGIRTAEEAASLARRLTSALEEVLDVEDKPIIMGASVGIALARGQGVSPEQLVKHSDIALYAAKAEGRGRYRFFEQAMERRLLGRQELKIGLRSALEKHEFHLHFQPMVGLQPGGITAFEALLRWNHPVHGKQGPAGFIPAAEESGLITPIGEWALRSACIEAAGWPRPTGVAVNLSSVQFRSAGLLQTVRHALRDSGLAPERLELEITESLLLEDSEANLRMLRRLRELGVRIVLDDFGTGFSSLSYVLRFPFDKIKIDRSFVAGLPEREEAKAIVRAVLGMGRSLGIRVAAEGVETLEQLEFLRQSGCSDAQGHLFGMPVAADEVPDVIFRLVEEETLIA